MLEVEAAPDVTGRKPLADAFRLCRMVLYDWLVAMPLAVIEPEGYFILLEFLVDLCIIDGGSGSVLT